MTQENQSKTILGDVLGRVAEQFKDELCAKGRDYQVVDLGNAYSALGMKDDAELYARVNAIVPLKRAPQGTLPVAIDGTELSDRCQLDSGIVVPEWVAEKSGLGYKPYQPKKRMTLHL